MGRERLINVRKLAAFELHFRRPLLILFEFAFVVFGLGGLGFAVVFLGLSTSVLATGIGVYLLFLALDYIPMLAYGISIHRRASARREIEDELADLSRARLRYGVQQTTLLVPLFIPLLALWQELRGPRL